MTIDHSTETPADAAERLHDAEEALRTFYDRLVDVERDLAATTVRADAAEAELAATKIRLETVQESEAALRHRIGELEDQIVRGHEEIHALHNSRTMRAVAFPRRVYAKLRSLVR